MKARRRSNASRVSGAAVQSRRRSRWQRHEACLLSESIISGVQVRTGGLKEYCKGRSDQNERKMCIYDDKLVAGSAGPEARYGSIRTLKYYWSRCPKSDNGTGDRYNIQGLGEGCRRLAVPHSHFFTTMQKLSCNRVVRATGHTFRMILLFCFGYLAL